MNNGVNLVISGGGARAVYAIGIAQLLNEKNINIDAISCVSGGSVVGAMMALNYQPKEILEILKNINFKKFIKLSFTKGLFSLERFKPILDDITKSKTVSQCSKKLYIWSIELESGDTYCFNQELISDAILASCALYPIFSPYKIDNHYYIDGGFKNNLPIESFVNKQQKIIAINLNPKSDISYDRLNFKKLIATMFYANSAHKEQLCDIYLEPKQLEQYSIFGINSFDALFEMGYKDAKQIIGFL
ncbi:MAG: patatin-like phospholipase family protein [Sulfurimonas sp.]|jgi:NTE family protein